MPTAATATLSWDPRSKAGTNRFLSDSHLYGLDWASASNDRSEREQASRNQREEKAQRRRQDKADHVALAKAYSEGKSCSSGVVIAPWAISGAPMQPWTSCEQCTKVRITAAAGKSYEPISFVLGKADDWNLLMSKQRGGKEAKKPKCQTSASALRHDSTPGEAAGRQSPTGASSQSLFNFKRRNAMLGEREKEMSGIRKGGREANRSNEVEVRDGGRPPAQKSVARPASAMARLSAVSEATQYGVRSLSDLEEEDGEVSAMSAVCTSHVGSVNTGRSGVRSPATRPRSALETGPRDKIGDLSFRIDAPADRPWRGGTAIGAGRGDSGKMTPKESNEMLTQMEGRLRAGIYKGGGWSGQPLTVGPRPHSALEPTAPWNTAPRPSPHVRIQSAPHSDSPTSGVGNSAKKTWAWKAISDQPLNPFKIGGQPPNKHGTLVINSSLPAKTKKQSWPSEGILDELRARSKTALAVSNAAPPASASTGAKQASSSREESRKAKRKVNNVTHCSGPGSNSQTPDPLAREMQVLLKLEARLEQAHGQLANGSGRVGRHHYTSDRTRWNSAPPGPMLT